MRLATTIEINKKELARELLTWRLRTGRTQEQAAKEFGLSRYSIMRAESEKYISISTAYRISVNLNRAIREENEAK